MKMEICLVILLQVLIPALGQDLPGEGIGPGENIDRPHRKCPSWGKWQSSKCLWPAAQPFTSLPKSCTSLPVKPVVPALLKNFVRAKELEAYSVVQNLYKLRGANSPCGYCSRKIECRQRQGGEWKAGCPFIQARIVPESCPGNQACVIKPILGACPPPVPLLARPRPPPRPQPHSSEETPKMDSDSVEMQNLQDELEKNETQGPPIWHCARNPAGNKCYCCCGFYFPNVTSGECVRIRKDQNEEDQGDVDGNVDWYWSGMVDFGLDNPFDLDRPLFTGDIADAIASSSMAIEQMGHPTMDNGPPLVINPDMVREPKPFMPPIPIEEEKEIMRKMNEI